MSTLSKFDELAVLLVRNFRGDLSQAELSGQLQNSFNIVNRWELQKREVYWEDFLALCQIQNLDVAAVLQEVTGTEFSSVPSDQDIFCALTDFYDDATFAQFFSKGQIHRLKNGKSKLRMSDFFKILDFSLGRCERFFKVLFKDSTSDFFSSYFQMASDYADLISRDINYSLLRISLKLRGYRSLPGHSDEFLAELLGLTVQEVQVRLQNLLSVGMIEMHEGFYRPTEEFLDTRLGQKNASRKQINNIRKAIQDYAMEVPGGSQRLKSAFLIYETNAELEKKVFEATNKFYVELTSLIRNYESNDPMDTVRYLVVELFSPLMNWEDLNK